MYCRTLAVPMVAVALMSASLIATPAVASPTPTSAQTGCASGATACDPNKTIRVQLSEAVIGDFIALDFAVFDHVVTQTSSSCTAVTSCDEVTLTVVPAFDDDAEPEVSFAFFGEPLRSRPANGSGQALEDFELTAADGIAPDVPTLAAVTQNGVDSTGASVSNVQGPQEGSFYTNQGAPVFHVTGVREGHTVILSLDSNASGDYEPSADSEIAECTAADESGDVACPSSSSFGADGGYDLLIAARDGAGNLSVARDPALSGAHAQQARLVLDTVAPSATGFSVSGDDLTVVFDEPIAFGRDFASDWIPREVLANGTRQRFVVSGVSGSGDSRTVAIGDSDYSPGDADELLYTLDGTPETRYQDRAGNYLGNFILNAGA